MAKTNIHSHLAKMLGTYVLESRIEKNILQCDLAKNLKMSGQFLGRIERGEVMIPNHALIKAVQILNLQEEHLNKIYRIAGELQVKSLFAVGNKGAKAKRYGLA
ncbi:MAG: helix-turn-helix transcriptional regulator [Bdellovibrionaceae bacterium]|nr:helix-turn-helix transcriptional regulator [Pseudobdellovibrionaceae bacterium]